MTEPGSSDYTGPDSEARRFLAELASVLSGKHHQMALIGGMAYNIWREPRYTKDLDFVILADEPTISGIQRELERRGFTTRSEQHDPQDGVTAFVQLVDDSGRKIVEFQVALTEFQDEIIERSVIADPALPFRVATPEDVIVLKLIAARPKDYTDVVNLAAIEGLDWDYIERWVQVWQVDDRLAWLRQLIESAP